MNKERNFKELFNDILEAMQNDDKGIKITQKEADLIFKKLLGVNEKLMNENKRYREDIEKAIDELNNGCKYHAQYVLKRALEEAK